MWEDAAPNHEPDLRMRVEDMEPDEPEDSWDEPHDHLLAQQELEDHAQDGEFENMPSWWIRGRRMVNPDSYTELEQILNRIPPKPKDDVTGVEIEKGMVVEIDCRCHDGFLRVHDPEPSIGGVIRLTLPKHSRTLDEDGNEPDTWPVQLEDVIPRPDLTEAVNQIQNARDTLFVSNDFDATVDTLDQALYEILGVQAR